LSGVPGALCYMNRLADHHRQYSAVLLIASASKKRSLTSGLIYLIKLRSVARAFNWVLTVVNSYGTPPNGNGHQNLIAQPGTAVRSSSG
jgi:hypothetical protein